MAAQQRKTLVLSLAAPIPRGHRVELTFLRRLGQRFPTARVEEDQPLVRDLDTGVEYGVDWHWCGLPGDEPPSLIASHQAPHLLHQIDRVETGVVRACRLVTATSSEDDAQRLSTTLVLDLDAAEGAPYR